MQARDVRTVGVVGCGLMGSGIVEVVARIGVDVVYLEPSDGLVEAGRERIETSTGRALERGKLTAEDRDAILGRISGSTEIAAFAGVDLVIEAATEDPEIKLETFRTLDEVTRDEVVLGSNTSSIPIATLGAVTARPDRVIGMHFFNPPPVMGLVELTPSLSTSEETVAFARGFGERLGKTVVVAKDHAGFIVNRLVIPYLCAAIRLLDEGFASREDIDTAMTLGMNHPMGPLRLADFIGLDTVLQIAEVLHAEFRDPSYAPPPRLQRMVDAGHLGRKSGQRLLRLLTRKRGVTSSFPEPFRTLARARTWQGPPKWDRCADYGRPCLVAARSATRVTPLVGARNAVMRWRPVPSAAIVKTSCGQSTMRLNALRLPSRAQSAS